MKSWLEEHPNFRSNYEDNPIETLESIKKFIHDPVILQHPMLSMTDELIRLINTNQYEKKRMLGYVKIFKHTCDALKSQPGTEFLDTSVSNKE